MYTCEDCSHRGLYSRYVVYSRCVTRRYISPFCKRSRVSEFTPFRFLIAMPWATPRGKSDGGGVGGAGRGRSNKIGGPSCPRFGSSRGASVVYVPIPSLRRPPNAAAFSVVRCTAIPTCADRGNASAVLSVCCSPHRPHLPAGRGLKSSAASLWSKGPGEHRA